MGPGSHSHNNYWDCMFMGGWGSVGHNEDANGVFHIFVVIIEGPATLDTLKYPSYETKYAPEDLGET